MSDNNVFNLPIYGKPIELSDAGVYYANNKKTGAINNVFHLAYETDLNKEGEWYLYQLKNTSKNGEMGWVIGPHAFGAIRRQSRVMRHDHPRRDRGGIGNAATDRESR